ncbi:MAG TPA: hypothetical protein VFV52_16090 [Bacilli bacterium]|nr:hypothetical protein [Bacilli bacterium]
MKKTTQAVNKVCKKEGETMLQWRADDQQPYKYLIAPDSSYKKDFLQAALTYVDSDASHP